MYNYISLVYSAGYIHNATIHVYMHAWIITSKLINSSFLHNMLFQDYNNNNTWILIINMFLVQEMGYHYCIYVANTCSKHPYLEGFPSLYHGPDSAILCHYRTTIITIFMSGKQVAYANICMNCLYHKYTKGIKL